MKKGLLMMAVVALLALPVSAMATSVIGFNDNGTWIQTASWDWNVGNALADNSVPLSTDINNPTPFTLYYQADLSNFLDSNGAVIGGTDLNSVYEVTVVAGFGEVGYRTDVISAAGNTLLSNANFSLDSSSPVNFFEVYYDDTRDANSLAGTGFDDGTLIMSGVIYESTGAFTVYIDTNNDGVVEVVNLDNFGVDNYPTIDTLAGNGSASIMAQIDDSAINPAYIDANVDFTFYLDMFFNSSTVTPFQQQQPSALVVGNAPAYGAGGTVNGLPSFTGGPVDFHFQADGNSSFTVVPEPSTMILLGIGMLGLGGLGVIRRKRQN